MARKKKGTTPKQVEAITHDDTRVNLPTADAHDLVPPTVEAVETVAYPREIHTPMLVWKGKEEQDATALEVDAPPIYIQEKIDPRVIIDRLQRTEPPGPETPSLFESFDGLDEMRRVEFYEHDANWTNRMILGDSLQVMASLDTRERLRGKVQMIYMDPPYGIKFASNWQVSARKRDVKDGKMEDVAREAEQIKAFRDTWELGIHSYLSYLRDRLLVARDLLTESGSVFLQIGDENVHLVRGLLDEVFGAENFVSLITIAKTTGVQSTALAATADYVLWFAKDSKSLKYRQLFRPRSAKADSRYDQVLLSDGTHRPATPAERAGIENLPAGAQLFQLGDATSDGQRKDTTAPYSFDGKEFHPGSKSHWKTTISGMDRLTIAGRLQPAKTSLRYRRFKSDFPIQEINNVWMDISGSVQSRVDPKVYVVQSSTALVERCLLAATDPGDLVLDPTCGAGTTAITAEQWGRRWITIDTSRVALALARQRLLAAGFAYYVLKDSEEGDARLQTHKASSVPPGNDVRQGFALQRVQRITLGSIANNPDIKSGMTREAIDAVIRRHAEYEELVNKPFEDSSKVRVTGPFTVESLSPHRQLAFARNDGTEVEPRSEREADADPDAPTFEQTILGNLAAAGVQNGKRNERLTFEAVEPYAGTYIQAVGINEETVDDMPRRVGIAIGPQYGTVGPKTIKDAAREAGKAKDLDLVCILAFHYDPMVRLAEDGIKAADESFAVAKEQSLGAVPILLVRMNQDLNMGEELKKTGAGNLFTVFGEPDIEVRTLDDGQLEVELRGVDVFDPTTGEVRTNDPDQIALWMIDTDYDRESFFVRHCYFTGGQDPYKRLKRALKAEIDADAWDTLYRTTSTPFRRPDTGKIAVKVINDYGDEVVKVFDC